MLWRSLPHVIDHVLYGASCQFVMCVSEVLRVKLSARTLAWLNLL